MSGVLVKGEREKSHMVLKDARKPRNTGILLNIQLVNFNCATRKLSQNYILYKYVKLHLLHRHLSSYKRNKQMTMYQAKFIMCQVLNQAHCIKHFTDYKQEQKL